MFNDDNTDVLPIDGEKPSAVETALLKDVSEKSTKLQSSVALVMLDVSVEFVSEEIASSKDVFSSKFSLLANHDPGITSGLWVNDLRN